jgi:hypothetical protein
MNTFLSGKVLQERFHGNGWCRRARLQCRRLKLPGDYFPAEHRDWLEVRVAGRSSGQGPELSN